LHGQFEAGSIEDFIVRAGVDIAFGKADTEQKIQEAIEKYGDAEAYRGYAQLASLLNN